MDTLIIPQGLLIHEKNQSSKISCYCPFKSYPMTIRFLAHLAGLFKEMYRRYSSPVYDTPVNDRFPVYPTWSQCGGLSQLLKQQSF